MYVETEDQGCVDVASLELPCGTAVLKNREDGAGVVDLVFFCSGRRYCRKGVGDVDRDVRAGFWI